MKKVKVRLDKSSYDIHIGPGILMRVGHQLREGGFGDKLVIVTNPIVQRL